MNKQEKETYKLQLQLKSPSVFVKIEDVLEKFPFFLEDTRKNAVVEIVRICIVGNQIQLFSFRSKVHPTLSLVNMMETHKGEELLRFFEHEATRLLIPTYPQKYLPRKDANIQDTRPALKEEHGALEKIIYTQEETAAFYVNERAERRVHENERFMNFLEEFDEDLKEYGSYETMQCYSLYYHKIEKKLHSMQYLFSPEEMQRYRHVFKEKKMKTYSDEERRDFKREKITKESIVDLDHIYEHLSRAKLHDENMDAAYDYQKSAITKIYNSLETIDQHRLVEAYMQKFLDITRKVYFT